MRIAPYVVASLVLTTGCTAPTTATPAAATRPADSDAALERTIHDLVNAHRRSRKLAPLTLDATITRTARAHSAAMAERRRLSHDGFADRAKALGRPRAVAENVAYDMGHADPAQEMVRGWLRSREHRENIEGPYERTGVGAARNAAGEVYVTQLFVQ